LPASASRPTRPRVLPSPAQADTTQATRLNRRSHTRRRERPGQGSRLAPRPSAYKVEVRIANAGAALVRSDSRTSAGTGDARAMGASGARTRDVAVIAVLHPLAPLGTSGGFDRAPDVWTSPPGTLRGSPDLLCKLRSSTRIECDDRVNVSRVKNAVNGLDQPDGPHGRGQRSRGCEARQCACGTPEVGRWPAASGDSERCPVDVSEAGLQLARR
jgi:hypothetical protein